MARYFKVKSRLDGDKNCDVIAVEDVGLNPVEVEAYLYEVLSKGLYHARVRILDIEKVEW